MQKDSPLTKPGSMAAGTRCPPPCGKVRYYTRAQAKAAARRIPAAPRLGAYRCATSGFWHHTSDSAATRAYHRQAAMSTMQLRAQITAHLRTCQSAITAHELSRVLGRGTRGGGALLHVLAGMEADGLVRADRADPRRTTWRAT